MCGRVPFRQENWKKKAPPCAHVQGSRPEASSAFFRNGYTVKYSLSDHHLASHITSVHPLSPQGQRLCVTSGHYPRLWGLSLMAPVRSSGGRDDGPSGLMSAMRLHAPSAEASVPHGRLGDDRSLRATSLWPATTAR